MNYKSEKNIRKYHPTKIAETIREITNDISVNFNKQEYIIYSKWHEIVGDYFVNFSEPQKLKISKENKNSSYEGILTVDVTNPAAIEFQHFIPKIIEKINSFLGYKAVTKIKLVQVTDISKQININKKVTKKEKSKLSKENELFIQKSTSSISSKNLKKALLNLGKSVFKNK